MPAAKAISFGSRSSSKWRIWPLGKFPRQASQGRKTFSRKVEIVAMPSRTNAADGDLQHITRLGALDENGTGDGVRSVLLCLLAKFDEIIGQSRFRNSVAKMIEGLDIDRLSARNTQRSRALVIEITNADILRSGLKIVSRRDPLRPMIFHWTVG